MLKTLKINYDQIFFIGNEQDKIIVSACIFSSNLCNQNHSVYTLTCAIVYGSNCYRNIKHVPLYLGCVGGEKQWWLLRNGWNSECTLNEAMQLPTNCITAYNTLHSALPVAMPKKRTLYTKVDPRRIHKQIKSVRWQWTHQQHFKQAWVVSHVLSLC